MLGNAIIAFIVGGAFLRAGAEYGKNGMAWGAIGLASFFGPSLVVPILVSLALKLAGANKEIAVGSFTAASLLGFAAGVAAAIWTYNKLMERAIEAQAAKDAQELSTAAQKSNSSARLI